MSVLVIIRWDWQREEQRPKESLLQRKTVLISKSLLPLVVTFQRGTIEAAREVTASSVGNSDFVV